MHIIGVTGGIGSGKSVVCTIFNSLGIPVFYADDEARDIYRTEPRILADLRTAFGDSIFSHTEIDRKALADLVFNDKEALTRLNAIVHPMVGRRFKHWMSEQQAPYVIREAAILIESGSYKDCSDIIHVIADEQTRISRVMTRSDLSENEVRLRISRQMTDAERKPFCSYEIHNNEKDMILPQVMNIHKALLEKAKA